MSTVTVPVLKPLTYQGRSYVRGDRLTLPGIDAAALAMRGLVSLTKGAVIAPAPAVERTTLTANAPTGRRGRRRYRRRDLVPEPSAE